MNYNEVIEKLEEINNEINENWWNIDLEVKNNINNTLKRAISDLKTYEEETKYHDYRCVEVEEGYEKELTIDKIYKGCKYGYNILIYNDLGKECYYDEDLFERVVHYE